MKVTAGSNSQRKGPLAKLTPQIKASSSHQTASHPPVQPCSWAFLESQLSPFTSQPWTRLLFKTRRLPICLQWHLRELHTLAFNKGLMVMMVTLTRMTMAQHATPWAAIASCSLLLGPTAWSWSQHIFLIWLMWPGSGADPHQLPSSCYLGGFIPH